MSSSVTEVEDADTGDSLLKMAFKYQIYSICSRVNNASYTDYLPLSGVQE